MNGLVRYQLNDAKWGLYTIYRPIPKAGESWGCLAPLKGTEWEKYVPVVDGENMSHALHGYLKPLLEELGPEPRLLTKKIPEILGKCSLFKDCLTSDSKCIPSGPPPDCYEAKADEIPISSAATALVLLWKQGAWVVVVEGGEFSI